MMLGAVVATLAARTAFAADPFRGERVGQTRSIGDVTMIWAPPGRFRMGSPVGEPQRRDDDAQVEATLTKGFWIGRFAVTQGQWRGLTGSMPGELSAGAGDLFPVYNLSHPEAETFCDLLTRRERAVGRLPAGWAFRLPTEAQWEYAAR
ncbi:MAG TPA: SUMF1/EgtB/PvdO family nonheme iron enzyme, partial [Caulobacteraceae bacterium]|nr:SUMF1/EgtB/PvdO family nonheme iron enzyme [Caulobacteraceae bacterium]